MSDLMKREFDPRIEQCPNCHVMEEGECDGAPTDGLPVNTKCMGFKETPRGFHEDETQEHPSYGHLSVNKVSSGVGEPMVGSSVRHHTWVEFKLSQSTRNRSLNKDCYYKGKTLAVFSLSPVQLFEMLTTMNSGGMPCTLMRYQSPGTGELVVADPPPEDVQVQKTAGEFVKQTRVATAKMRVLQQKIKARAESGKAMGKKELEQLAIDIGVAAQETDSNLPFVKQTFEESVEKAVTDAKAEVDAFITGQLVKAGMDAFKSGAAMPELPMGEPKRSSPTPKRVLDVLLDRGCKLSEVPKDGRFKFSVRGSEFIKLDGSGEDEEGWVRVANAEMRVAWWDVDTVVFPVKE